MSGADCIIIGLAVFAELFLGSLALALGERIGRTL